MEKIVISKKEYKKAIKERELLGKKYQRKDNLIFLKIQELEDENYKSNIVGLRIKNNKKIEELKLEKEKNENVFYKDKAKSEKIILQYLGIDISTLKENNN